MLMKFLLLLSLSFQCYSNQLILDFDMIFEEHKVPRLVIESDTGKIVKANKEAAKYYKYDLEKLLTMNIKEINMANDKEVTEQILLAQNEKKNYFRFKHKNGDGQIREVEVYSYPIYSNEKLYLYSLIFDVTEKVRNLNKLKKNHQIIVILSLLIILLLLLTLYLIYKLKEKYKEIAYKDSLTGINNRRVLERREFFKENYFFNNRVVVMLDINDFKEINDNYGHLIGDKVLKVLANLIKESLRSDDLIVRYGGDEFLLILTNINVSKVKDIMRRLEEKLTKLDKFPFKVKISYGIKAVTTNTEIDETIRSADEKMYKMKKEKIK